MAEERTYIGNIVHGLKSSWSGLRLSFRHMRKGYKNRKPVGIADSNYFSEADKNVTIQYPLEKIPVTDLGRYRLHMETEDCIVCDKCARICPVDCIEIESFKSTQDLGYTSDGSKKRLELPVFDIDMAKCCFCGLCTTVCPTECLTMTKVYDYSEVDRQDFVYHFGALSPEEAAKRKQELEKVQAAKTSQTSSAPKKAKPKRPMMPPKKS